VAYTLNQSILWAQSVMATYIPLTAQTGSEPAISIANMVVAFILNPPFTWPMNRAENTSTTTTAGTQDYTVSIANFGYLESITLTDSNSVSWAVPRIYNAKNLGTTSVQTNRPEAACVRFVTPGTSVVIRFMGPPDAAYTATMTYQKAPVLFTATSQDWFTQCNIFDFYLDIFNNLFLAECLQVNGDPQEAGIYRRRGMAALIAKADGLTQMQQNMMLDQATRSDIQQIAANLRTQQAAEARSI
jgi:hypothetical protein